MSPRILKIQICIWGQLICYMFIFFYSIILVLAFWNSCFMDIGPTGSVFVIFLTCNPTFFNFHWFLRQLIYIAPLKLHTIAFLEVTNILCIAKSNNYIYFLIILKILAVFNLTDHLFVPETLCSLAPWLHTLCFFPYLSSHLILLFCNFFSSI